MTISNLKYLNTYIVFFLTMIFCLASNSQNNQAFKSGEWFKYKISYSGWFKAGEATVNLTENKNLNEYHAKMVGKSTGPLSLFFKVGYTYEKQLDKNLDIAFSTVARDVKNCDRYQNTKNVKSIASTVKKAWLRHGALNHWKEIREFFDRKMTDDEFLEWKTNFRMKTKNSDRSTIKVKT